MTISLRHLSRIAPVGRSLCLAALVASSALGTLPAQAASTAASSAGSAGSASSGSVSDSIGASSNSSGGDERVAAGAYQVIDVAPAPSKGDTTRMTLRATAAAGNKAARAFHLDVPNRALAARRVATGDLVQVNQRVYGYEFAHADTNKAFFLALQDAWYRELGSHKVAI